MVMYNNLLKMNLYINSSNQLETNSSNKLSNNYLLTNLNLLSQINLQNYLNQITTQNQINSFHTNQNSNKEDLNN